MAETDPGSDNAACARITFNERLSGAIESYANRTNRLLEMQRLPGFLPGGETGAKLVDHVYRAFAFHPQAEVWVFGREINFNDNTGCMAGIVINAESSSGITRSISSDRIFIDQ